MLSLKETKQYLRVEFEEEDALIKELIKSAQKLCLSMIRSDDIRKWKQDHTMKIAMLYCVAYLYEHREKANHKELNETLRALLFGCREEIF
ncbi:MAG: head-tail connector protein [Eubacteriales bacterium]